MSNGTLTSNATRGEKGERGKTGGFSLTADSHFQIKNKRLTNSAPVDDGDAMTKTLVTDLLKEKAGTTSVKNEIAKKANKSTLSDYVLKSDFPFSFHSPRLGVANQPFLFIKRTTNSNKVSVKFSTALRHQINHPPGKNGVINSNYWLLVNKELEIKKIRIYKIEYSDLIDGTRIAIIQSSTDGGKTW